MSLDGRMAIVTGGGSGIGRGISLALAAKGAPVAVLDLREDAANETVELIKASGGQALALSCDTSSAVSVDKAVSAAVEELGPLEIMVNNAGILDGYFNVDEIDIDLWKKVIDIDLTGVFLGCRRALQEMLPAGRGRIVNTASTGGLGGTGGGAAYIAAKHGVVGLTRQMAVVYSARGVMTNAICPGPIATNLRQTSQAMFAPGTPDRTDRGVAPSEEQVKLVVPASRRGKIEEIAAAVCYLVSEEAAYISGQALAIDGGWTAK